MQFRRQKNQEVTVNLTPLIDVVFLLLIFFMVSTSFTKETHLSLDLPEATGEAAKAMEEQIEIVINSNGQYTINGRTLVNARLETLKSALDTVSQNNREMPLIITADARTPHQSVITAMDGAAQLGFAKLSLTTKKPVTEQ